MVVLEAQGGAVLGVAWPLASGSASGLQENSGLLSARPSVTTCACMNLYDLMFGSSGKYGQPPSSGWLTGFCDSEQWFYYWRSSQATPYH